MKYFNLFIALILLGFVSYSAVEAAWPSNRGYGYFPRGDGGQWSSEEKNRYENTWHQDNYIYPEYAYPAYTRYPTYYPNNYPAYDPFPDSTRADQLYQENLQR